MLEKTEIHANMGGKRKKTGFPDFSLQVATFRGWNLLLLCCVAGFKERNSRLSYPLPWEERSVNRSG